jgi:hypothetical protein
LEGGGDWSNALPLWVVNCDHLLYLFQDLPIERKNIEKERRKWQNDKMSRGERDRSAKMTE